MKLLHFNKKSMIITYLLVLIILFQVMYHQNVKHDSYQNSKLFLTTHSSIFLLISDSNDTDSDGIPDDWEEEHNLDPEYYDSNIDYDFDDLENIDEYHYNTDPWNPDTDGDKFNDGFEVAKGTDPLDSKDHPIRVWVVVVIVLVSGGLIALITWVLKITIHDKKEVKKGKMN